MADIIKNLEEMDGTLFAPIAGGVKDGSIITNMIKDRAVTLDKLVDESITSAKIATGAVTTDKLMSSGIGTRGIADLNITTTKLATDAVNATSTANGQITTAKIANETITKAKLGSMVADETMTIKTTAGSVNVTAKRVSLGNKLYMILYQGKPNLNVGGSSRGYLDADITFATPFTTVYTLLAQYAMDGDVDSYTGYTAQTSTGIDGYIYCGGGAHKIIVSVIAIGTRAS